MTYTLKDIEKHLEFPFVAIGNAELSFGTFESIFEARPGSLSWLRGDDEQALRTLESSEATFVICRRLRVGEDLLRRKCLIQVDNPQLSFLRLMKNILRKPRLLTSFIHPTAVVSEQAKLGAQVYIGEYAVVGNCTIGSGSIVKSHSVIHDHVRVGSNVLISEHCNIGGEGFGHIRNESDRLENMPHIGSVVLEDDVEIFPFTNIDRATLSTTFVGRGTKIDHYCHIGHNTVIGEDTVITPNVTTLGGCKIGDNCWLGAGTMLRDRVILSNRVTTGMGSMVTKNVPEGETWVGAPARPLEEFKELQLKLSRL